jgi:catalase (peroxidase I)
LALIFYASILVLPIPRVSAALNSTDWDEIRNALLFLVQKGIGPTCVRIAGHAALGYDKATKSGGLQDFLRFHSATEFGSNNGTKSLNLALVQIKRSYPDISYTDLYSFCAAVTISNSCGPEIIWRPGRIDPVLFENHHRKREENYLALAQRESKRNNLNPSKNENQTHGGARYLRDTYSTMGLSDKCAVALMGAHGIGRGRPENSGYANRPRTYSELRFSNSFFTTLANMKWYAGNFTYNGMKQVQYFNLNKTLAMLPTDLAVAPISDANAPRGAEIDPTYRTIANSYVTNKTLFFGDFKECFQNLLELGVTTLAANPISTRRADNATLCSTLNETTAVLNENIGTINNGTIELLLGASVADGSTSAATISAIFNVGSAVIVSALLFTLNF